MKKQMYKQIKTGYFVTKITLDKQQQKYNRWRYISLTLLLLFKLFSNEY